jgi:hypothetical protein
MNRKPVSTVALAAALALGAACGGGDGTLTVAKPISVDQAAPAQAPPPTSASKAHHAFDKLWTKYAADIADMTVAFAGMGGGHPDTSQEASWLNEVDNTCRPSPDQAAGEGFAMMLMAPVLAKHRHTWPDFRRDYKAIDAQIVAEGLCK